MTAHDTEARTLPLGFSDRRLHELPKDTGPIGRMNIQPNSPLKQITSGPMLQTVVRVRGDFDGSVRYGTAFHAGGGIFLSAAHTFHRRDKPPWLDCNSAHIQLEGVWRPLTQYGAFVEFKQSGDRSFDLAICAAPELRNLAVHFPLADARADTRRKPGKVVGYPREGSYDGTRLFRAEGIHYLAPDRLFYMHKASTLLGDSGGPLLNAGDVAVGVHTQGDQDNRAVAFWDGLIALVREAIARGEVPG
jgi:V8-like Glu-specific endopeptidase